MVAGAPQSVQRMPATKPMGKHQAIDKLARKFGFETRREAVEPD